jgi:hypothetical protein
MILCKPTAIDPWYAVFLAACRMKERPSFQAASVPGFSDQADPCLLGTCLRIHVDSHD